MSVRDQPTIINQPPRKRLRRIATCLFDLPIELLVALCVFLDIISLYRLSRTCHCLSTDLQTSYVVQLFYQRHFPDWRPEPQLRLTGLISLFPGACLTSAQVAELWIWQDVALVLRLLENSYQPMVGRIIRDTFNLKNMVSDLSARFLVDRLCDMGYCYTTITEHHFHSTSDTLFIPRYYLNPQLKRVIHPVKTRFTSDELPDCPHRERILYLMVLGLCRL